MVNFLRNVVLPNERCVCVFTNQQRLQQNLRIRNNSVSESGVWKLNMTKIKSVTKVVIYYRHNNINEIIVGDYRGIRESNDQNYPDRYYIKFDNIRNDQTLNDWKVFCDTGSNPVRYT
jgi:hypothetical protein